MAASDAVQQTQWLRRLLQDCTFATTRASKVLTDNTATMQIAKNSAPTKKRKLIDIPYHHLVDHVQRNTITMHYVASAYNIADMFTKALGKNKIAMHRSQLHICDLSATDPNTPSRANLNQNPNGQPDFAPSLSPGTVKGTKKAIKTRSKIALIKETKTACPATKIV